MTIDAEPDPAVTMESIAAELVRAFAAVASLLDDERFEDTSGMPPDVATRLEARITDRLRSMAPVFDADDLHTTWMHLAEAIDNLGAGLQLEPWRVAAFRLWRDWDGSVMSDLPVLSDRAEAARADLLRHAVVLLGEEETEDGPVYEVSAPDEELAERAVGYALPGSRVRVAGRTPRRILTARCVGWRDRGHEELRVYVQVLAGEHIENILCAEDDEKVVVLATVCSPLAGLEGAPVVEHGRVVLRKPLGDRQVIDGCSRATLKPVPA